MKTTAVFLCCFGVGAIAWSNDRMDGYNVIWNTPSGDRSGQMPLGNGDIAAGVYAIGDDALYLLLAKNDAYNYNGDIFKTGRARIALEPNPFKQGKPFKQSLDLKTASVLLEAGGVNLRVWADANRPVYHVQIKAPYKMKVRAKLETWKRFDTCEFNRTREPIDPPTQDVVLTRKDSIISYFAVGDRSVYPTELKYYEVEHMASQHPDPYRFNTFGNLIKGQGLRLKDGVLQGEGTSFNVQIHSHCAQEPDLQKWIADLEAQAAQPLDVPIAWKAHCSWWSEFWNRSWILVNDNTIAAADRGHLDHEGYVDQRTAKDEGALVGQSYNVFRYLMACQSRGRVQVKFNGGLFTHPMRYGAKIHPMMNVTKLDEKLSISHEDDRLWGRRFTFQNQRLLYWPLLMSGDYDDLMKPFFDHYWNLLPLRKEINKAWFGHAGAYFRENVEPTGGERDCGPTKHRELRREDKPIKAPPGGNKGQYYAHSFYFTSGLETVAMMIDYVKYSGNGVFRDEVLVPFAREILLFYDLHYGRDENGKIRLDPSMLVESYKIAVNPASDVAGLLHNLDALLAMGWGNDADRSNWRRMRSETPDVHLHEIDPETYVSKSRFKRPELPESVPYEINTRMAIAPGLAWGKSSSGENGELYPVFPFPRFGSGRGTKEIVAWTMLHRTGVNFIKNLCWTQDQIHWAYAGNGQQCRNGLVKRFRHAYVGCRFPLFGREGPDSCPDLDHFGSGSIALQRMLVQEVNEKILLLPAWPRQWDTDFKLHLSGKTVISGTVQQGKLTHWEVQPVSRKKDVVVYDAQ